MPFGNSPTRLTDINLEEEESLVGFEGFVGVIWVFAKEEWKELKELVLIKI
jgi:hypothetical protein